MNSLNSLCHLSVTHPRLTDEETEHRGFNSCSGEPQSGSVTLTLRASAGLEEKAVLWAGLGRVGHTALAQVLFDERMCQGRRPGTL